MARHRVRRAPAPAVRARHAPNHNDAPVFLRLGRRVRISSSLKHLAHRCRRVLERKERRDRVRLEALLQVVGRGGVHRGRPQQARRAHPHVEPAVRVEHLVDEHERLVLLGHVEGVGDDLGAAFGVGGGDAVDEGLVGLFVGGFVACFDFYLFLFSTYLALEGGRMGEMCRLTVYRGRSVSWNKVGDTGPRSVIQ